jgi:tRNA uridine 5-carboxymethylaminomethyl modification enzyme
MFTSRAEHRILLRQDNADKRLTEKGYHLGLTTEERYQKFKAKEAKVDKITAYIYKESISPDEINTLLSENKTAPLKQKVKLATVLLRPQVSLKLLIHASTGLQKLVSENHLDNEMIESAEIQIKYEGYIKKEEEIARKLDKFENMVLKEDFDYNSLLSISTEARQKLSKIKPKTIGQASRISGVSPSDINVLLVFLGR